MAKTIEINPSEVRINTAIAARFGDPDPERIGELAENFVARRESGRPHQLQAGLVRSIDGGYEVIAGRHRLLAELELNKNLGKGEEPYLFTATVVRADEKQALIDSITENEYRVATNIFDRGDAVKRLLAMGMSQADISRLYKLSEATISQTVKAADLPKKLKKMVMDGDMEQEAALLLGSIEDTATRQEVIEHCVANRNFFEEMEARLADAGEEVEEVEEEEEEETEETGKGKGKGKKAAKKAAKGKKAKISENDAKRAVKEKGAKVKGKTPSGPATLSRKQFLASLEALGKDKENPLPKSARTLLSRVAAFYDGDLKLETFRKVLLANCVPDASE